MTVYVDNARTPYGRMKMSHMVADTREELLAMADRIGLDRKHIQQYGEPNEHFDVSASYRAKAIAAGAVEISSRGLVKIIRRKRSVWVNEAAFAAALAKVPEDQPDDPFEPAPVFASSRSDDDGLSDLNEEAEEAEDDLE